MKYLILFDTKYPYRKGESFLESEIKEIASFFDKIIIFPIDILIGEQQTRTINELNVDVYLFENEKPLKRKIKAACKSLIGMWKFKGNLKSRFLDSVFENTAQSQTQKIIKILNKISFNQNDKIILYGYWLYMPARIEVFVKKWFEDKGFSPTVISRAHRFDIYEETSDRKYLPQRELLLKQIDKIFACSTDGAEYLKNKYSTYYNKVTVGLLGTYDFGLGAETNRDQFFIVSCSRVTKIKRVELIAQAISKLQNEGFDVFWTHIGDGPEIDTVKNAIKENKIKNVTLLGSISNTEVLNYYRNNPANIFINVSTSEGLPVSIMEAISFGIPVIATDVGGTREIVNNTTGKLLDTNIKSDDLSNVIKSFINMDYNDYITLRKNVRNFWVKNFNAKLNYSEFAKILLNL